tara:strand:- start:796 stop:2484 length:1689 start_codon:yes stop_codon:yes gene_type:complete
MTKNNNLLFALKYRPKSFKELFGQEVMVQTISNSISSGKIPNAYLLTGIRGVGKTTTARIIAKALNCSEGFKEGEICKEGESCHHCKEISQSNHIDVLEMDAASKTGIDDIRELIDSSKYKPNSSKFKIFIIDEVHMLSKQAFNGLLKTLEEPPIYLKFIFATTEVNKIPLTIISRCQRFDLKRVSLDLIEKNLHEISLKEGRKISKEGVRLIAQSSEGSVRDSLSLLEKILNSSTDHAKILNEKDIQNILGFSDKSEIIDVLKSVVDGSEKFAIQKIKKLFEEGIEPKSILNDFLEVLYIVNNIKSLQATASDLNISETNYKNALSLSENINLTTLMVYWQIILRELDDIKIVSNQFMSVEMLIFKLLHIKTLPNYEELLKLGYENTIHSSEDSIPEEINISRTKNIQGKRTASDQIKNISQKKPEIEKKILSENNNQEFYSEIKNFEDLVKITSEKRDIQLKHDLVHNVSLINFSVGQIDISFNDRLNKNFIRNLSEKLYKWTGKRWIITLAKKVGDKTINEKIEIEKRNLIENFKKTDSYENFIKSFPDAKLIDILKKD